MNFIIIIFMIYSFYLYKMNKNGLPLPYANRMEI